MRAEILCVGSEILLGQIVDTNAAYIATQLARSGVDVYRKQVVGDNLERIADCISGALARADVLIITGGLGPTTDDLTREAIAVALGVELEYHSYLEDKLRQFFARRGIEPGETIMRQAYLPAGTSELVNPVGTAPGVLYDRGGKMIFAVPGVPREMTAMLDGGIIPALLERLEGRRNIIVSRLLRAFGVGESSLAEPIEDILTTATNPTVAPLIYGNTEVHLRLTAKAGSEEEARVLLDEMEARIRGRVGEHIFGIDNQTLPTVLLNLLVERGLTLAVAESVTGGVLSGLVTGVPGASKVYRGGVVAYDAAIKHDLLGVSQATIDAGVVSDSTVAAMAEGVRRKLGADLGLATTGEAGPDPATNAAVGKVFIGISDAVGTSAFERDYFGDREIIRQRASLAAVDLVRRHLLAS